LKTLIQNAFFSVLTMYSNRKVILNYNNFHSITFFTFFNQMQYLSAQQTYFKNITKSNQP